MNIIKENSNFDDVADYAKKKSLPNWNKGFGAFMNSPDFRLHYTNDGFFI